MGVKDTVIEVIKQQKPELVPLIMQEDEATVEKKWYKFADVRKEINEGKYSKTKALLLYLAMDKWDLDELEYFLSCTEEKVKEIWNEATVMASCPGFVEIKQRKDSGYYERNGAGVLESNIKELVSIKDELSESYSSNERKIMIDNALHSMGINDYYEYLKTKKPSKGKMNPFIKFILFFLAVCLLYAIIIMRG